MKIFIDPKDLIESLTRLNPGMDLTGVKAYLFDLATAAEELYSEEPGPVWNPATSRVEEPGEPIAQTYISNAEPKLEAPPVRVEAPYIPPPPPPPPRDGVSPWSDSAASDVMGKQTVAGKKSASVRIDRRGGSRSDRDAERAAKRNSAQKMADMTTKELLESLTKGEEPTKEGNQYLSEGIDDGGGSAPGEMEIG